MTEFLEKRFLSAVKVQPKLFPFQLGLCRYPATEGEVYGLVTAICRAVGYGLYSTAPMIFVTFIAIFLASARSGSHSFYRALEVWIKLIPFSILTGFIIGFLCALTLEGMVLWAWNRRARRLNSG